MYVTKETLDQMRAELQHMKAVERPAASKAIAEAREKGDLSENAEYDAAKDAQGMLELKINDLLKQIDNKKLSKSLKIKSLEEFYDICVCLLQNGKTVSYNARWIQSHQWACRLAATKTI